MINNSTWDKGKIQQFERTFDLILQHDHNALNQEPLINNQIQFENYKAYINELVEYFLWKTIGKLKILISNEKNPNKRFFKMVKFSMINNRYNKLFIKLNRAELDIESRSKLDYALNCYNDILINILIDKGVDKDVAESNVMSIQSIFFGWSEGKADSIRIETEIFTIFKLLRPFLFPSFREFKNAF